MVEDAVPWAHRAVVQCTCGAETRVLNTRGRPSRDIVWRQRQCVACGRLFSTYESVVRPVDIEKAIDQLRDAVAMAVQLLQKVRGTN